MKAAREAKILITTQGTAVITEIQTQQDKEERGDPRTTTLGEISNANIATRPTCLIPLFTHI
jgi:hypothetical protein